GACESRAVCVALYIGLLKSAVLSMLLSPTDTFVIPLTVPVNVGFAIGAFESRAVCVALYIGLL
ncbi:MAG: hypothetical protein ACKPKO_01215, partial [Candidatus Fonsibacter sp.]